MDNTSHFKELLEKDNSVSIHQKSLQLLMIGIYITKNRLNPLLITETFYDKAVPYWRKSKSNLNLSKVKTTYYGTDTVWFLGQRVWEKLPI